MDLGFLISGNRLRAFTSNPNKNRTWKGNGDEDNLRMWVVDSGRHALG